MHLLFALAACCCALLVGVAAALWWSIRREHSQPADAGLRSVAEMVRQVQRPPHPRMDLAAGVAAGSPGAAQHVYGAPRRRGLAMDDMAQSEAAKSGLGLAGRIPGRPDWAFFNGEPGDFSDPDPRRAPAGGVRRPLGTVSLPESR